MAHLQQLGTSIADQIFPTFAHYAPLLRANASTIRSIPCSTFTYGPSPRHQLDVYTPLKQSTTSGSRHPVLLFFYGGGFVQGNRTLPVPTLDGLVHANVASFFAQKYGYTVVVPDYRLLSQGAEFPSGGEDVALTLKWVSQNVDKLGPVEKESNFQVDLFILGNSAGGVHVSTFLFCDAFSGNRVDLLNGETKLRGVVLLSVPFSYNLVQDGAKREVLDKYFRDVEQNCPLALLKDTRRSNPGGLDFAKSGTKILVLNAEWDPEDECLRPRDEFVQEWGKFEDTKSRCALVVDSVLGHNHISPFLALGTNIESEEAWGHLVANFCNKARTSE